MATSKRKGGSSSRSQPVAIEMLIADHRTVDKLFKRYEDEKESDDETKRGIALRVCGSIEKRSRFAYLAARYARVGSSSKDRG